MVRTYGFKHDELLQMPIKRFWFYHRQVTRLRAEEDIRTLSLLGAATSGEGFKSAIEKLHDEVGEIYVMEPVQRVFETAARDPEFDRGGFEALRAMAGADGNVGAIS